MKIHSKTIIITGATGGIGGALVGEVLAAGGRVAAVDANQDALEVLRGTHTDAGERLSLHRVDITDRAQVDALPATVIAVHSHIDGLINNAGIIQPFVRIAELDVATIERVMNVNFYGTLFMIKALLPHLLSRSEASLVNVSSMGGFLPVPGQGAYGASKAAVKLLSESLFAELAATSVRVTTVFPGATNTHITANSGVDIPLAMTGESAGARMVSPEVVARQIVRAIEKQTPLLYTGSDARLMNWLYRLMPVRATRLIANKMKALLP